MRQVFPKWRKHIEDKILKLNMSRNIILYFDIKYINMIRTFCVIYYQAYSHTGIDS